MPKNVSINSEEAIWVASMSFERKFESEFFVKKIIWKVPPCLATALQLICFQGKGKEQSAKIVGLFEISNVPTNEEFTSSVDGCLIKIKQERQEIPAFPV